ncbi:MAG: NlpC/P60 family protein [candidate division WOR-3 bacterium]
MKIRWWWTTILLSASLPASSAQRTVPYTVQPGDSLYTIAHRFHLRLGEVLQVNSLKNPHALQPGTVLQIPIKSKTGHAGLLPQKTQPSRTLTAGWAEAKIDRINVRSAPSVQAKRLTLIDRWVPVYVLGVKGEWAHVRLSTGQTGWILSRYLAPSRVVRQRSSSAWATSQKKPDKQVSKSKRTRPAVASTGKSHRIRRARDHKPAGKAEVVSVPKQAQGNPILRTALSLRGQPYRYGGTTSRGFDCSGFTRYLYSKYGRNLPHSSAAQARVGKPVPKHHLRPGDLVFFRTRGRRISHVGVYIGNGKFIHASSARGRVRVDSLEKGYYKKRYAGARRMP